MIRLRHGPTPSRRRVPMHVGALLLALPALLLAAPTREERVAAYEALVEGATTSEGLLILHRKKGHLYAELSPEVLDTDLLLLPSLSRGIAAGRLLGGIPWGPDDWVLRFRREGERVLVLRRNHRFLPEPGTPLGEAVALSYSDSIVASLDIEGVASADEVEDDEADEGTNEDAPEAAAEEVEDTLLVSLDSLLLSDLIGLGDRLEDTLGSRFRLDAAASSWQEALAFEENVELRARLVYRGRPDAGDTIPDGRGVAIDVHYSLSRLARDPGYTPRPADDRVGYFLTALRDHSRVGREEPFRRYVNRWDLRPADPDAEISAVIEPLVFWIERTVPYAFRRYVRQGIEEWNRAFEAIGLVDAIEVRVQPRDATWHPEDVRYNTLRWVVEAPFTATGPSRAHPLTGRMLDADILYNGGALGIFHRRARLFGVEGGLGAGSGSTEESRPGCEVMNGLQGELALGAFVLARERSPGLDPEALPMDFLGAAVRKTVMHEVGHVLGLRHNFTSSTVVPAARLHDAAWTREHGLTGSVMDYVPANLALPGEEQGEYFTSTLGPYDYWAIEYGYARVRDPEEEASEEDDDRESDAEGGAEELPTLASIASRAAEPALAFGSDEDRRRALDPRTQAYDLGHDPLLHAERRVALVKGVWSKLLERIVPDGRSTSLARYGARILLGQVRNASRLAVPYVGGLYHHRDHKGDPNRRPPFQPVPAAEQRRALAVLADGLFSEETYGLSPALLNRLGPDHFLHWGSRGFGDRLDFPFHRYLASIQGQVLEDLLDPARLARMQDTARHAPPEQDVLEVPELLDRLVEDLFAEVAADRDPVRVSPMRRTLQRRLVTELERLVARPPGRTAGDAAAAARQALGALDARLAAARTRVDDAIVTAAHLEDLRARIARTVEARVRAP